jgi:hypothetical protein
MNAVRRFSHRGGNLVINVTHHAGVMRLSAPLALCDFLSQIGQANVGSVLTRNIDHSPQYLYDLLTRTKTRINYFPVG